MKDREMIKRYKPSLRVEEPAVFSGCMKESMHGDYVKFKDVVFELSRLSSRVEELEKENREAVELLNSWDIGESPHKETWDFLNSIKED